MEHVESLVEICSIPAMERESSQIPTTKLRDINQRQPVPVLVSFEPRTSVKSRHLPISLVRYSSSRQHLGIEFFGALHRLKTPSASCQGSYLTSLAYLYDTIDLGHRHATRPHAIHPFSDSTSYYTQFEITRRVVRASQPGSQHLRCRCNMDCCCIRLSIMAHHPLNTPLPLVNQTASLIL